jgi:hypothetical protein
MLRRPVASAVRGMKPDRNARAGSRGGLHNFTELPTNFALENSEPGPDASPRSASNTVGEMVRRYSRTRNRRQRLTAAPLCLAMVAGEGATPVNIPIESKARIYIGRCVGLCTRRAA